MRWGIPSLLTGHGVSCFVNCHIPRTFDAQQLFNQCLLNKCVKLFIHFKGFLLRIIICLRQNYSNVWYIFFFLRTLIFSGFSQLQNVNIIFISGKGGNLGFLEIVFLHLKLACSQILQNGFVHEALFYEWSWSQLSKEGTYSYQVHN